jgi:chlorobactene glucosyltransferase
LLLIITLINLLFGPRLARAPQSDATPKVSVLIPARNEAENIGQCLTGLLAQNFPNFEILVLNDHSTDQTAAVVQKFSQQDARMRLIDGAPLPVGWTGKNWACQQLSQAAAGKIFIFTDADTQHAPSAISATVAFLQKFRLGLLSAFPQQKTVTLAEKMIIPLLDLLGYSSLPLWLTYYAPFPSLAAANGQWLAFTRAGYAQTGGHAVVKHQIVEDTELSRRAKRNGVKILTTAGTGVVFCRMYHSTREVWNGFSKNFFGLTGYRNGVFFGVIFTLLTAFVLPYFLIALPSVRICGLAAIGLNLLLRALLAGRYRHPFWVSTLLHPVSVLFAIAIGLNSWVSFKRGKIDWKGREIHLQNRT